MLSIGRKFVEFTHRIIAEFIMQFDTMIQKYVFVFVEVILKFSWYFPNSIGFVFIGNPLQVEVYSSHNDKHNSRQNT